MPSESLAALLQTRWKHCAVTGKIRRKVKQGTEKENVPFCKDRTVRVLLILKASKKNNQCCWFYLEHLQIWQNSRNIAKVNRKLVSFSTKIKSNLHLWITNVSDICIYSVRWTPASNKQLILSSSCFLFRNDRKISSCPSNAAQLSQPIRDSICFKTFSHYALTPISRCRFKTQQKSIQIGHSPAPASILQVREAAQEDKAPSRKEGCPHFDFFQCPLLMLFLFSLCFKTFR